jgi:hypothetical protein
LTLTHKTACTSVAPSLFLARLALLLFQEVGDEQRCLQALDLALADLPTPSLSASARTDEPG